MESNLTKLEMDAVVQLIQLAGGGCAADLRLYWLDFPVGKEEEEGSVGETLSSSLVNEEKCLPEEDDNEDALPRRKERFGSLREIYGKTGAISGSRTRKRSRF